jgi:hypothetical protein
MNIRVLRNQTDLFEMSVLEQNGTLHPGDLEELMVEESTEPLVLVGKCMIADLASQIRKLVQKVFRSNRTMIISPPFGDTDIGKYFDSPGSLRFLRRSPDSICKVTAEEWRRKLGSDLRIRSDHMIETSLSAGIQCVDSENKPVLLRYQPTNTTGAVFISALQLLSYTALTKEDDRQALIKEILSWKNEAFTADRSIATQEEKDLAPNRDELVTVLLALDASGKPDLEAIQKIATKYLGVAPSVERISAILKYLKSENVIIPHKTENNMIVSRQDLNRAIENLGVHAYARELRALVRNSQGVEP